VWFVMLVGAPRKAGLYVVHVVPYYPPHIGGMERVAEDIVTELSTDLEVSVLTSRLGEAGLAPSATGSKVTVRRLWALELAHTPVMPTLLFHLLRLPRACIVHVHLPVAFAPELVWFTSLVTRRRYVAHYHLDADPTGPLGRLFVWYKRVVMSRVLQGASAVIAVSSDQPATLVHGHGVAASRVKLIPNGIDRRFVPAQQTRPAPGRPFRLLFVGRLAPQKNAGLLIDALARCTTDCHLLVVGDGEERDALRARVVELDLQDRVTFRGSLSGRSLVEAYQRSDALVLPSRKESTGLVLLEAMACGVPVVGTRVQGITETVGADGILVEPEPGALAMAIDRLATDDRLWRELSLRGLRRSHDHSWSTSISAMRQLYAEMGEIS
jgi:D-inositol-3-phosphate glycosyltransferase